MHLAFGDVRKDGSIDDYSISNNGDRNKILATVAFVIELYLDRYPDRWVSFKGSTPQRMRLYRMAITVNLDVLQLKFDIYAEQEHVIIPFEKNIYVEGILVKRKYL